MGSSYLLHTTYLHLFGFRLTVAERGQKAGCWAAVLCRWGVLYYPVLHHLCHCTRLGQQLTSVKTMAAILILTF